MSENVAIISGFVGGMYFGKKAIDKLVLKDPYESVTTVGISVIVGSVGGTICSPFTIPLIVYYEYKKSH